MQDIISDLESVRQTLTATAKALHNYEGDNGVAQTTRNNLRAQQRKINTSITKLQGVISKLQK